MAQNHNSNLAVIGSKANLRSALENPNVNMTLQRVATRWLSADQLKTQSMIAVARNPKLLNCTKSSFLESMVRAGELGLRFAGAGGEAYLVPYKSTCTLIIGYRGLCALARRTGKVVRIEARVVHEKDTFKVSFGSGQELIHQPCLGLDRGPMTCVYALAEFKGGGTQLEVMAKDEIINIRKRSRASKDGPWVSDFEEMSRKTVLRRLCKFLPFPTAFEDALASEDPSGDSDRKPIDSNEVPANVDTFTGEVIDQNAHSFGTESLEGTPETNPASDVLDDSNGEDIQDGESKSKDKFPDDLGTSNETDRGLACDPLGSDLAEQKAELINKILSSLPQGNSLKNEAKRLKLLKSTFGSTILDTIAELPLTVLQAGLVTLEAVDNE